MEKKKKDYLLKTLGIQFLVCALLFGFLFALQKSNSSLFSTFRTLFSAELEKNLTTKDVKEAFQQIGNIAKSDKSDDKETNAETEDNTLAASVLAEGGVDLSVDQKGKLPDNVSLDKYKLNDSIVLPVEGKITSPFAFRVHPITGKYGFHCGVDIAASTGTHIRAAYDGKVVVASYDQWNGNHIKIQHANGIMTVYCHCSKLYVKEGQHVRGGDVIGAVGSTGESTGPHLHFEFRINGKSYDPQYALKTAVDLDES